MQISMITLYHPVPWEYLRTYRILLVLLRSAELSLLVARLLLFRVPLHLVQTRVFRRPSHRFGEEALTGVSMLRHTLEELGPTFIKLGQILSMRPELPPTIRQDMQKIQDWVIPFSYDEVKKALHRELGKPMEEVFEWVEEKPIAAASLAQVHRAKLRQPEEEVALKIQRPHLHGTVVIDGMIIDILVTVIKVLLPEFKKKTDPTIFTVGFKDKLEEETDFILEGKYQERMRGYSSSHPIYHKYIKIARVHWDYTTGKLLTMELVKNYHRFDSSQGQQLLEQIRIPELSPERSYHLVLVSLFFIADGLFRYRFVHGDPHLGNLYVTEDGQIFICDFGMMDELTDDDIDFLLGFTASAAYYFDYARLVDVVVRFHQGPKEEAEEVRKRLSPIAMRVMAKHGEKPSDASQTILMSKLRGTATTSTDTLYAAVGVGARLPPSLWITLKVYCYLEEVAVTYFPDMDLVFLFGSGIKKMLKDKMAKELAPADVTTFRAVLANTTASMAGPDVTTFVEGATARFYS